MEDLKYLKLAIKLSRKGLGFTEPNPMVGAVVVKNGKILSTGYHKKFGDIHAERMALDKIDETGTTLYISLEPCCHFGKTPPCTDIIIKKKVKKVVIASPDPNPIVEGKGIKILKANGIEVLYGQLDDLNRDYNSHYFTNIEKKRPYVCLRAGVSIDGKLTDKNRDSKWMTNKQLRDISNELRSEFSAIMTGSKTVIEDNPKLTIKNDKWKDKKLARIILDSKNSLKKETNLNIFNEQEQYPTYFFTSNLIPEVAPNDISSSNAKNSPYHFYVNNSSYGLNLNEILEVLYEKNISSILVEGGGKLINSFLQEKLFDEVILFTDKKIIGGKESVELFNYGTEISQPVNFSSTNIIEFDSGYIFRGKK